MEPVIVAEGVCVRFPGAPAPVLRDLDLRVAAGESVAVMGPSGSGKSTLLSVLGCLRAADAGRVALLGRVPAGGAEADGVRARHIGFVFQRAHLLPFLTVAQNVLLGLQLAQRAGGRGTAGTVGALIETVGLGGLGDRRASQLSVGEAQRAAVARALVKEPEILLADEPTGALDADNAARVMDALLAGHGSRPALVLATHDPAVAARCDRVLHLHGGRFS